MLKQLINELVFYFILFNEKICILFDKISFNELFHFPI